MSIRILNLCVRLTLSITILTNVTSAVSKSNVTLDAADEKSFFARLRKKIKHSSSSSELENSPDRVKSPLTHFGEALISHHLSDTEKSLKEDLEEYMKNNDNDLSPLVRYKIYMTNQMSPLVNNFIVHSKRGKHGDKYCDFRYILIPKIGAGNTAFVIHSKVIDDPKKLKSEAKLGLSSMKKANVDASNDETKIEPMPDLLLGKKFREFYYRLQTHLKLAFTLGPGIPPTHEGYRRFMYRTFRPLLKQGYLVKSCKKTGSCKCDHLIVPKDNFGQFVFVMNYTVVEPEFKMVFEPMTIKGLARMKKFKMGCDLNQIYANARYKYRFFFLFSGRDVQMRYDKLF